MAFEFPDAPVQDGNGKLKIEFTNFFYVVNFRRARTRLFRGAVVLCPSPQHETHLNLRSSNRLVDSRRLHRAQVDLFVADPGGQPEAVSKGNDETGRPLSTRLPKSKDLFARDLPIKPGLMSDRRVPAELNARVVLAGGVMTQQKPRCEAAAEIEYEFHRPGEHPVPRRLTDRVDYDLDLISGKRYWLVVSDGRTITEAYPLPSTPTLVEVFNRDPPPHKKFAGVLESYALLHDTVLEIGPPGSGEMRGPDPGCPTSRGTAEPICGGEQGDPDPPEDPPDPPDPNP
jgi:hypothetical protein